MLNVAEMARRLRVCKATVYKLVEQGKLAHVRVGNSIRFVSDLARSAGAPRGLYGPDSLRASPKKRK